MRSVPGSDKRISFLVLSGIFLISLVAYASTFKNTLVCDDYYLIGIDKMHVFGGGGLGQLSAIRWLFYGEYLIYVRPVTLGLWSLISSFAGLEAWPYHLADVLLHAASAAMIYFLLKKLSVSRIAAFLAAVLFALTPVAPEAVAWPAGVVDTLPLFFILLSLYFYVVFLQSRRLAVYAGALLAMAAAMFSKEVAIPLILLIPLADILFSGRMGGGTVEWTVKRPEEGIAAQIPDRAARLAPFAVLLLFYLTVRYLILGSLVGQGGNLTYGGPDATMNTLSTFLAPLSPLFVAPGLADFMRFYIILLLAAGIFLLVWRYRQIAGMTKRVVLFMTCMMLLAAIPVSGIVFAGIGQDLQWTHTLYIPTAAMLAAMCVCLIDCGWNRRLWAVAASCALAVLLPLFFWGLHQNNLYWEGVSVKEAQIMQGIAANLPDPPAGTTIFIEERFAPASSRVYWCKPMLEPAIRGMYKGRDLNVHQLARGEFVDTNPGYLFVYDSVTGKLWLAHEPLA